jgi:hypothetical protein
MRRRRPFSRSTPRFTKSTTRKPRSFALSGCAVARLNAEAAFRVGANMTGDGPPRLVARGGIDLVGEGSHGHRDGGAHLATQYVEPIDSALKNLLSVTTDLSAGELFCGFCGEQDGRACSN